MKRQSHNKKFTRALVFSIVGSRNSDEPLSSAPPYEEIAANVKRFADLGLEVNVAHNGEPFQTVRILAVSCNVCRRSISQN